MALVFLSVDYASDRVIYAGYSPPWQDNHNVYVTVLDDNISGVKDLLANVNAQLFTSVTTNPYIKANYDGTNINASLINSPANVSSEAKLSILGNAYTCQINNGAITFPISIHSSVQNSRIPVSIIVDGFPHTSIEIGGSNGNIPTQIYMDDTGVYQVVPENSVDLANYWQNSLVDLTFAQADIATITGLLAHTLFHYVIPTMQNQQYKPLVFTSNEQNGLIDIQTNILPSQSSTLSNISPVGQAPDLHYISYRYHIQQAKQAMDQYVADRNEIMKYATLK